MRSPGQRRHRRRWGLGRRDSPSERRGGVVACTLVAPGSPGRWWRLRRREPPKRRGAGCRASIRRARAAARSRAACAIRL